MPKLTLKQLFTQTRADLKRSHYEEQERYENSPYSNRVMSHLAGWGYWKSQAKEENNE